MTFAVVGHLENDAAVRVGALIRNFPATFFVACLEYLTDRLVSSIGTLRLMIMLLLDCKDLDLSITVAPVYDIQGSSLYDLRLFFLIQLHLLSFTHGIL